MTIYDKSSDLTDLFGQVDEIAPIHPLPCDRWIARSCFAKSHQAR